MMWCNMYSDALTFRHSGVKIQTHKQNVCNLDYLLGRIAFRYITAPPWKMWPFTGNPQTSFGCWCVVQVRNNEKLGCEKGCSGL